MRPPSAGSGSGPCFPEPGSSTVAGLPRGEGTGVARGPPLLGLKVSSQEVKAPQPRKRYGRIPAPHEVTRANAHQALAFTAAFGQAWLLETRSRKAGTQPPHARPGPTGSASESGCGQRACPGTWVTPAPAPCAPLRKRGAHVAAIAPRRKAGSGTCRLLPAMAPRPEESPARPPEGWGRVERRPMAAVGGDGPGLGTRLGGIPSPPSPCLSPGAPPARRRLKPPLGPKAPLGRPGPPEADRSRCRSRVAFSGSWRRPLGGGALEGGCCAGGAPVPAAAVYLGGWEVHAVVAVAVRLGRSFYPPGILFIKDLSTPSCGSSG